MFKCDRKVFVLKGQIFALIHHHMCLIRPLSPNSFKFTMETMVLWSFLVLYHNKIIDVFHIIRSEFKTDATFHVFLGKWNFSFWKNMLYNKATWCLWVYHKFYEFACGGSLHCKYTVEHFVTKIDLSSIFVSLNFTNRN